MERLTSDFVIEIKKKYNKYFLKKKKIRRKV